MQSNGGVADVFVFGIRNGAPINTSANRNIAFMFYYDPLGLYGIVNGRAIRYLLNSLRCNKIRRLCPHPLYSHLVESAGSRSVRFVRRRLSGSRLTTPGLQALTVKWFSILLLSSHCTRKLYKTLEIRRGLNLIQIHCPTTSGWSC